MTAATATSLRRGVAPGAAPGLPTRGIDEKPAQVRLTVYGPDHLDERDLVGPDALSAIEDEDAQSVVWIDVVGAPRDVATLQRLGAMFDIHPLALEDILNASVRPKSEIYDHNQFIVVRAPVVRDSGEACFQQVAIVLGARHVLSFQEGPDDLFEPVRMRLRAGRPRIRGAGADYLAYALIDAAIDLGYPALEAVGDRSDELEQVVLDSYEPTMARDLHALRTNLLTLRRTMWPMRDVMIHLLNQESPFINESTRPFLRDCQDHVVQLIDLIEIHREQARGLMDMHVSALSNRMNEIMKVLTLMASVFIPLTFVAGLYGMNFEYMPELHAEWGYPIALVVMVTIALVMILLFRRWGWIGAGAK